MTQAMLTYLLILINDKHAHPPQNDRLGNTARDRLHDDGGCEALLPGRMRERLLSVTMYVCDLLLPIPRLTEVVVAHGSDDLVPGTYPTADYSVPNHLQDLSITTSSDHFTLSLPSTPLLFSQDNYHHQLDSLDGEWNSAYLPDGWYGTVSPGQAIWGAVPKRSESKSLPGRARVFGNIGYGEHHPVADGLGADEQIDVTRLADRAGVACLATVVQSVNADPAGPAMPVIVAPRGIGDYLANVRQHVAAEIGLTGQLVPTTATNATKACPARVCVSVQRPTLQNVCP